MSDNEHTAAALGHSEILRIENAIRDVVDWPSGESCVSPTVARNLRNDSGKPSKHDCKVSPVMGTEKSWDILDNHVLRTNC
jgi:hypothetical protein